MPRSLIVLFLCPCLGCYRSEGAKPDFAEMSKSQRIGHVEVRLTFAERTQIKPEEDRRLAGEFLVVSLDITNHSTNRRVEYRSWHFPVPGDTTSVADEHRNTIRNAPDGVRNHFMGGNGKLARDINPGDPPLRDVLVYEVPLAVAEHGYFILDARNVGESGEFRFHLPASVWRK